MKCANCSLLILFDSGYSNWTVEETEAHCLRNANPDLPGNTGFGEDDESLQEERECEFFCAGKPASIDVDREDVRGDGSFVDYFHTDEAKAIVAMEGWRPKGGY